MMIEEKVSPHQSLSVFFYFTVSRVFTLLDHGLIKLNISTRVPVVKTAFIVLEGCFLFLHCVTKSVIRPRASQTCKQPDNI